MARSRGALFTRTLLLLLLANLGCRALARSGTLTASHQACLTRVRLSEAQGIATEEFEQAWPLPSFAVLARCYRVMAAAVAVAAVAPPSLAPARPKVPRRSRQPKPPSF